MKVLFINDSTSSSNWGDRAAAWSLKAMVAEADAEDQRHHHRGGPCPDAVRGTFRRITTPPCMGGERSCDGSIPPVMLVARRRVFKNVDVTADDGVIAGALGGLGRAADLVIAAPDGPWPWLRAAIRRADLVVVHGDGAMVGEGIIPRTDLFLAYLAHERLDTPVVLVNHSADFDRPELRRMAEHVYPLLADVVFRDPVSATRWGHLGVDASQPTARSGSRPPGAMRGYPLPDAPPTSTCGRTPPSRPGGPLSLPGRFLAPQHRLAPAGACALLRGPGRPPAHRLRGPDPADALRRPGAGGLSAAGPRARPAAGLATIPVQQAVDILGNADAYVGGRWHSAIFALRAARRWSRCPPTRARCGR